MSKRDVLGRALLMRLGRKSSRKVGPMMRCRITIAQFEEQLPISRESE